MSLKVKPKQLSTEKYNWVKNRKGVVLRGLRLNHNVGIQREYEKALRKLIDKMALESQRKIIALFKKPFATQYFDKQREMIAAADDTIYNESKILLKALTDKFSKMFDDAARPTAQKMWSDSEQVSSVALGASRLK
jgi:hypothetical protein